MNEASPRNVAGNVKYGDILISKFKFQSRYYQRNQTVTKFDNSLFTQPKTVNFEKCYSLPVFKVYYHLNPQPTKTKYLNQSILTIIRKRRHTFMNFHCRIMQMTPFTI